MLPFNKKIKQECRRAGERKKRQFAVSVHFVSVVSVCFFVAQHSIKHHGITNFTYFINKICCTLRQCACMKCINACKKGCRWLHHQQIQINIIFKFNKVYVNNLKQPYNVLLYDFILGSILSFLYYHLQLKQVLQAFHLINLAITMAA